MIRAIRVTRGNEHAAVDSLGRLRVFGSSAGGRPMGALARAQDHGPAVVRGPTLRSRLPCTTLFRVPALDAARAGRRSESAVVQLGDRTGCPRRCRTACWGLLSRGSDRRVGAALLLRRDRRDTGGAACLAVGFTLDPVPLLHDPLALSGRESSRPTASVACDPGQ